jgi:RloB-like protein
VIESRFRHAPSRNPRPAILIALEDLRSARLYFEGFKKELKAQRVIVIAPHVGSAPKSVIDAAIKARDDPELKNKAGLDEGDEYDKVWVVFDTEGPRNAQRNVDARHAIERARQLGFQTAVSNPSFEYWLLIHFEWCVKPFQNGDAVCRLLKKHIPDFDKGKDCFLITLPHVQTAIGHAKRVFAERYQHSSKHPCDCHPCTEIYRLVESLLSEA